MTRKVKIESTGEHITLRDADDGVWLGVGAELRQLSDVDLRRLITSLARTKAARQSRASRSPQAQRQG
jgi:hypothetical protein